MKIRLVFSSPHLHLSTWHNTEPGLIESRVSRHSRTRIAKGIDLQRELQVRAQVPWHCCGQRSRTRIAGSWAKSGRRWIARHVQGLNSKEHAGQFRDTCGEVFSSAALQKGQAKGGFLGANWALLLPISTMQILCTANKQCMCVGDGRGRATGFK